MDCGVVAVHRIVEHIHVLRVRDVFQQRQSDELAGHTVTCKTMP